MARLRDVANSLRATNNGATRRSFDIMFDDVADFDRVWSSGVVSPALIAGLYGLAETDIQVYGFPPANAIKIVMPRKVVAGSPDDTDIDGKQQHAPLLDIEVGDWPPRP